jgi:integrase/recombinase XerD
MLSVDAVSDFAKFCTVECQLSPHTVEAYRCDLSDFTKWLGAKEVGISAEQTLRAYLDDMVLNRKLSAATVRRRIASLRAFFKWHSRLQTSTSPFQTWRPILPRRKRLPRTLSRSEARNLLAKSKSELSRSPLFVSIRLMMSTGIRIGELCKLRVEDVSPEGTALRIHGKGSRDRVTYVSDTALQAELVRIASARRVAEGAGASMFLNRRGLPLRPQSIRLQLRKYADRAGIGRRVTPHMLRHTAATLLIETGVDIRFVQRLLGHSSIAMTEIYTHVSDEALQSALARADVLRALSQP